MKLLGVLLSAALIGGGSLNTRVASAATAPNAVTLTFAESLRVTMSAPGTTYRYGAPVPITISITNTRRRDAAPIRWSCHQFAEIHVVSTSRYVSNSTQDLGPATLLNPPSQCGSAIGWLRPHHAWVARQEVILLHLHLAAAIGYVVHNVDRPGWVDEPVYTPALNFRLLEGSGK